MNDSMRIAEGVTLGSGLQAVQATAGALIAQTGDLFAAGDTFTAQGRETAARRIFFFKNDQNHVFQH